MPINSARVIIEVSAGVLMKEPLPEYTKRWGITSEEFYGPENRLDWNPTEEEALSEAARRKQLLLDRYSLAVKYAEEIMNPNYVNWVRIDWIWL